MRLLALGICAVFLMTAGTLTSASHSAVSSPGKPSLRLVKRQPFVLQGLRFKTRERVTVTVTATDDRWLRSVRATRAGTFTVDFGRLPITRCEQVAARAVGRLQSRTTLKLALPECPVPIQPVA